ncbi:iron-containing alcohol dehydrogenase [Arthrobacter humicola]|uniref:iron-containing alcohol dehydrogenase n=1 Tax=Arthrobacter humicola TaxID=409291 RepID=UPI001FAE1D25|nr:iron-containing alcohol dehydrogenase [Arthrobacter humicola]MCI9870163.1 iron-containing alcohol dehydrogenase [Arthrobacter humicola]
MTLSSDLDRYLSHPLVGLDQVVIGADVLDSVHDIVAALPAHNSIAVLTDEDVYTTGSGTYLKPAVTALLETLGTVTTVALPGHVHADETTVNAATAGCAGADVIVTIGSGTLCDIGKVAAGTRPHVVVQSAASVNGFADDQSVLLINGVKRTAHSGWPSALVVDSNVLEGAPALLNRSGLGDMISMFTAPADWYLSSLVEMDRGYSAEAATMTRRHGGELLGLAPGVGTSDPESLSTLAKFVTLSGISMGVAGQTSPSSGMEHVISHLLDMANTARGTATAHHGAQVGVATVVVAILWRNMNEKLRTGSLGTVRLPEPDDAERTVREAFDWMDEAGSTSNECWSDYSKKLEHLRTVDAGAKIRDAAATWPAHAEVLSGLLGEPEAIVAALRAAGAPTRFSELENPSKEDDVIWALTNCHLMRNRFNIADLAYLTGAWTKTDVLAALAEAERIGAGL